MYVNELLNLDTFKGCRFVTECIGENITVTGVNVMEVPDIYNWVNQGELLLTAGYSYRHRPEEFADIIPLLKKKGIAVLGFKTHRFFDEIPQYIIESAENCGLPIIEIAENIIFSNIAREMIEKLLQSKNDERYADQFYMDWLHGNFRNLDDFKRRCLDIDKNIDFTVRYQVMLLNLSGEIDMEQIRTLSYRMNRLLQDVTGLCVTYDEENVILIISEGLENEKIDMIRDAAMLVTRNPKYKLCRGRVAAKIFDIEESYKSALNIAKFCRKKEFEKNIIDYGDIGIYALLSIIIPGKELDDFVKTYLQPILDYDKKHQTELMLTLRTYLESNANAKATAKDLYIHYNTIMYRLDRIKEVLGMDISVPEIQLCINCAIKLYDMYS